MASLTDQQKQTAVDAIIHMEGTDGSDEQNGPTKPGWGGGDSALSYGQFQNDISQGENKYDVISNKQALQEILDHDNYDRTLDNKIVTFGSTPVGAKAIRYKATPTDEKYNDVISSALPALENLPVWQAQDRAAEHVVIDKLNGAINYINDNNVHGAGSLSWSHLDPKALMALAAWTNQHPNIMPMVKILTAAASFNKPITTKGLLDAIYQQPYFQGPNGYSSTLWQKRIDDTVQYVNHKEHDNFNDSGPPSWLIPSAYGDTLPNGTDLGYLPSTANAHTSAADTLLQMTFNHQAASSAWAVESASGYGGVWDLHDAYANVLARIGAAPRAGLEAPARPHFIELNNQIAAAGKVMFDADRSQASPQAGGAAEDISENHHPDQNMQVPGMMHPDERTSAFARAVHQAIHGRDRASAGNGTGTRRNGPTGHRDDPIFVYY